ncbi:interleukin-12 subunit alpha [Dromiciops gliroides]|uniref:interleukin-12 subunit alpha n=1 Tax=Dromiciops gliroides TaxID=33562 RepID=UPI001CC7F1F6|nr:interleukin-12 subunit alpha [Dromiciops gliroides]
MTERREQGTRGTREEKRGRGTRRVRGPRGPRKVPMVGIKGAAPVYLPNGSHLHRRSQLSPASHRCAPIMGPRRDASLQHIFLLATLIGLSQVDWAKSLPVTQPEPNMHPCLRGSKNLLEAVSNTLQKARQKLELYSCSSEEIDHEDITEVRTSTLRACLPPELAKNESCLVSRETLKELCLRSIYEDLETYKAEFNSIKETLAKDPTRQISLDQNMLASVDEMMQALNFNSENVPLTSSPKEPDFYKTKVQLCILLHAFRIRAVTIDRMMNYLAHHPMAS